MTIPPPYDRDRVADMRAVSLATPIEDLDDLPRSDRVRLERARQRIVEAIVESFGPRPSVFALADLATDALVVLSRAAETSGRDPRAWAYLVSRLASARVEALGPLRGPGSTPDAETPESRPLRRENGVP